MKTRRRISSLVLCLSVAGFAHAGPDDWTSTRLLDDFHAEGAAVGDVDGDGHADITYGPFWFAGPDFETKHRFTSGDPFVPDGGYSDNFFSFVVDATGDGANDILVYGFPGKSARLYVNPGGRHPADLRPEGATSGDWAMHEVAPEIGNESPAFVDIVPGGLPEIVCTHDETYGYYEAGDDATKPWTWRAISAPGDAGGRFEHGLGVGDVNGDGRLDIVQRKFWYEHPGGEGNDRPWRKHGWAPMASAGGAQILVEDLDGDGDSDLVYSLRAHAYGIAWFEQVEPGRFARHDLVGSRSTDNPWGVCFSQPHALTLADVDGDGRTDFVTGKRYFAHNGKDPGGLQAPVLYWFRNTETEEGGVEFVPHLVHDDSGVGVEITAADVNGDGRTDLVSGNKKGLTIHLQRPDASHEPPAKWQVPGGRPQADYGSGLSPEEALERIEVPEGFSVDLVAAEPDVTQPIAMCFDARGRLWVVEGRTYPRRAEGDHQAGKDRILVFEDGDGDGRFEKRKVFAKGVNLASGIQVGFGGVFVGAAPYLLFYPDEDGDAVADGDPEILLDGWGHQDTHETLNAFTWGPDGWLYGCHGVFTHSSVGRPGAPEEKREKINGGVWRYHPVTRDFEVFAHGTSNPWGVDFDERGECFISACVIPHFYHLSQGGRYQRQSGQHFDPYTFADIQTIADHAHYAGNIRDHAFWGENKADRPAAPSDTSALGGGHAHCGLALYQADAFPARYRGDAFFHNLHGHRMVREKLETDGSGYVARHRPDFTLSNDHQHIGVALAQGPDGALYYSDWVDPQTCHHRGVEIWDRSNGRIFRVRHGEKRSPVTDLPDRDEVGLVAALGHANAFHARQAQRLLQERSATGALDGDKLDAALADFEKEHAGDVPLQLRALWTRHACRRLPTELAMERLDHSSEHLRSWTVRLLGEPEEPLPEPQLRKLERMAAADPSLVVRRRLASLLQRLPLEQRWGIAEGLVRHRRSGHDRNVPLLCWYGIEPLVEADPERALALAGKAAWPQLKEFVTRRATLFPAGRGSLMTTLSRAGNPKVFLAHARHLLESLAELPPVERPEGWEAARKKGRALAAKHPPVGDVLARLGARFGDPDFFPHWREIARNDEARPANRREALELLTAGGDPELAPIAREALAVPALRGAAIDALRDHPGSETAEALVARLDSFSLEHRNEAINLLATRPAMALVLLRAIDRDQLPASLVSPVLLDQLERFEHEEIATLVGRHWTRGDAAMSPAEAKKAIAEWKRWLTRRRLARADASQGRRVFKTTCGACHQLFGEGVALGPDLTGSNRADLDYLLENVVTPSAVVGKDYLLTVFTLENGSTLSGMVAKETPEFVTVAMPGGSTTDIPVDDIESREQMTRSTMPPGLFDTIPKQQVADLVKYLQSPKQVPLPGQEKKAAPESSVPPPADGVTRIEGEALTPEATTNGGSLKAQLMSGFGAGWSDNRHLWWTGGEPGDVLTLKLEQVEPGTKHLVLFPTTAKDYARIEVSVNGQLKKADLYTPKVLPGEPIRFENVTVSPGEALQVDVHITGKNEAALPRYMVGIDRIEVAPAEEAD